MFKPLCYGYAIAACLLPVVPLSAGAEDTSTRPSPLNEVLQRLQLPQGFKATLFAAEPDVVQPIAMTMDARGRLWVVEGMSYPTWQKTPSGQDRVIILEDKDGDGHFDSKKVFWDKGRNLSGIAVGMGGVWLCSAPELLWVPDRDGNDIPDGPPEPVLDGWTIEAKHNIFNNLTWGPDGWLYGCHGILAESLVGRPGAGDKERLRINCGVWRFHPTRRTFEVVAHGTTNPWGIAFNDFGQMFVANCVIKHLFHIIPGARYDRMYGQDMNPYSFKLIESCANHIHWAGGWWKTEGAEHSQNDEAGGGHAHCGAMVYLGDNWPDSYRNTFFTLNVHGRRINNDLLDPSGSGYVAYHRPDPVKVTDPWFRGVSLIYGPDGGVFVSDWSDAGECHDYEDIHRENGRIYKITYGEPRRDARDLRSLADEQLVRLQLSKNDWQVSQARLVLEERATAGKLTPNIRDELKQLLREQKDVTRQLRALWALEATAPAERDTPFKVGLLDHSEEWVRAWAVRFLFDGAIDTSTHARFAVMSKSDPSRIVRRELASGLQRLELASRLPIAAGLASHAEDGTDPNLPLLIWYGIEPIASSDDVRSIEILEQAKIPLLRQFIAQRMTLRQALDPLITAIRGAKDPGRQRDVVKGMFEALNGRRGVPMPNGWVELASELKENPDEDVREQAVLLAVVFGEQAAVASLRAKATDPAQPALGRQRALQALVQARAKDLVLVLQSLVSDPVMRGIAIRGLAAFDDPATPQVLLSRYKEFSSDEKADVINTLATRPEYAVSLLKAVNAGDVPSRDVSPFAARQIQELKDERIAPLLADSLGQIRLVSKDKSKLIAQYREWLTPEALRASNPVNGRALFKRTCAACHTLFGEGGTLAPELTGSQRTSLDYLLENVVDPNAVVWSQYRATYFETADDQLISGVVLRENESTVTIQTQTGTITLPVKDITSRRQSNLSMMPEGLLESLSKTEVLDLVAYLQSPSQASPPQPR